jgi:adenine-specific DNA-methyltransferase
MSKREYSHLTQSELIDLLRQRDAQSHFGIVWERDEIDRDKKLNDEYVSLLLREDLSHGVSPYENLIIEGDNYDALRHLLMTHAGRIQTIVIDPPYNTGNKSGTKGRWVYNDRFFDPKSRFRHSTWLEFMYSRLQLANDLLSDAGVIFIHISDTELYNLKLLMDKVFGPENFIGNIVWKNATDNNPTRIAVEHEYILAYVKKKDVNPKVWKSASIITKETILQKFDELKSLYGDNIALVTKAYKEWFKTQKPYLQPMQEYDLVDEHGPYTGSRSVHNPGQPGYFFPVIHPNGKVCTPPQNGYRFPPTTMDELLEQDRIIFGDDETKIIELKLYAKDFKAKLPGVIDMDGRKGPNELKAIFNGSLPFNNPKPSELIAELLTFVTGPNDIVLDFFAGSGTTGHAVLALNKLDGGDRKFILVSSTEAREDGSSDEKEKNVCRDVCAERMRRVMQGYALPDGTAITGLGGSFAYLEATPILKHRLEQELDNQTIWNTVLLAHSLPVRPLTSELGWVVDSDGVAIAYPCGSRKKDIEAFANMAAEHPGPIVCYAWAAAKFAMAVPRARVFAIPETLTANFRTSLDGLQSRNANKVITEELTEEVEE